MLFFWLRIFSPKSTTKASSFVLNKFERKISGTGAVRARQTFTLFVLNEDVNDIIEIVESLENSGLLIDGTSETVKHEIKKTRRWISWGYDHTSVIQNGATWDVFNQSHSKKKPHFYIPYFEIIF